REAEDLARLDVHLGGGDDPDPGEAIAAAVDREAADGDVDAGAVDDDAAGQRRQDRGHRAGAVDGHRLGDGDRAEAARIERVDLADRKSTRLNSSHVEISYAVFCLKKKKKKKKNKEM